jgi:hypothetical protein
MAFTCITQLARFSHVSQAFLSEQITVQREGSKHIKSYHQEGEVIPELAYA